MKNAAQLNRSLIFLIGVILIDFMGMATVVVIFPKLFLSSSGIVPVAWSDHTKIIMLGILLAIYPFGQIIGASFLGKLSDQYGRRNILLITLMGTILGFSLSGIAITINSMLLLLVSRFIAGLSAGNVAIAQASLLDISTPDTKVKNIAYSQMAMGSAYIVGPILGAWLCNHDIVSWFNLSTPFWFFTLILVGLLVLTLFSYKETLVERKKTSIDFLESIHQMYTALTSGKLRKVFVTWLIFVSGWWLFESFMPAFLFQDIHLNTDQIGILLAFNGALYTLFQYLVVQRLAKNMSPIKMVQISGFAAGLAIISMPFTSNVIQLYLAMAIFVMAMGFCIPGLITTISNLADENEQGQTMGMINSIQAIATVAVMLLGGLLNSYQSNISVFGGGFLIMISWAIFIAINSKQKIMQLQNE